jgi:hypothetical protein
MDQNNQIVVVVEGGSVMSVFAAFRAEYRTDVEILDFDHARADPDDPGALNKARERLELVEYELEQIY